MAKRKPRVVVHLTDELREEWREALARGYTLQRWRKVKKRRAALARPHKPKVRR